MSKGRPFKHGKRMVVRSIRVTDWHWDELNRRGGPDALRKWLDVGAGGVYLEQDDVSYIKQLLDGLRNGASVHDTVEDIWRMLL